MERGKGTKKRGTEILLRMPLHIIFVKRVYYS